MPEKREGGQVKDEMWLVLTESVRAEGGGLVHRSCGTKILGKIVNRPVWDGPGCSGGGDVKSFTVPYCPNCETEPNSNGTPIIP